MEISVGDLIFTDEATCKLVDDLVQLCAADVEQHTARWEVETVLVERNTRELTVYCRTLDRPGEAESVHVALFSYKNKAFLTVGDTEPWELANAELIVEGSEHVQAMLQKLLQSRIDETRKRLTGLVMGLCKQLEPKEA